MPIGTETGTGIKELIFSIDVDDGYCVVKMGESEVTFDKQIPITVGDHSDVGFKAGGAGHGYEETDELVIAAAFASPNVVGGAEFFEALCLLLLGGVLAGIAGIVELHHRGVEFAQLLLGSVGWDDKVFDCRIDGGTGTDELVLSLSPELAFVLPE